MNWKGCGHGLIVLAFSCGQVVKLTAHFQLVLKSRILGSIQPHHGIMLNYLSIGTTLPSLPVIFPEILRKTMKNLRIVSALAEI
jgi:hypothetical protein